MNEEIKTEISTDCSYYKDIVNETVTLDETSLVSFRHLNLKDDTFKKTYICRDGEKIFLKDLWENHKKFKQALEEIREMVKYDCVRECSNDSNTCTICSCLEQRIQRKIDEVLK